MNILKNMKLKTKIISLNILFLLYVIILMTFLILNIFKIKNDIKNIADEDIPLTKIINNITRHQLEQSIYFEQAFRYSELYDIEKLKHAEINYNELDQIADDELRRGEAIVNKAINRIKEPKKREKYIDIINRLKIIAEEHNYYENETKSIFSLLYHKKNSDIVILAEKIEKGRVKLYSELGLLIKNVENLIEESSLNAETNFIYTILFMTFLIIVMMGVFIIISFFISSAISKPVKYLMDATKKVGEGNREILLKINSTDEIGQLAVSFNHMIEDLKQTTVSRDYFSYIIESMIDSLIVLNQEGNIRTINKAATWMLGYQEEELVGMSINIIINDDELLNKAGIIQLINNKSIKNVEKECVTKDGSIIPVLLSISIMQDKKRSVQGIVCVAKDITIRKQAEEKIKNLSSELLKIQEKERQKISKDLHDSVNQTILAAKLNLDTYKKDPVKYKKQFDIGMEFISKANRELKEIYMDLYPSILTDFGLEETLKWYLKNYLEVHRIHTELKYNIQQKLPHDLEVNMYRIFQELFSNIIKHSRANTVKILVEENEKKIIMEIHDNGIGISETKTLTANMGFGLLNIAQRVQYFNGSLDIQSEKDIGTNILIEFPF